VIACASRAEGDAGRVVDAHPRRDAQERRPHPPRRELEQSADGPDEQHHQPAEHVQLRVQVDDQVAGVPAAVEQLVHGRQRLDRPLERPDGEGGAPDVDERP